MVYPELEEKLQNTKRALEGANSENIIELCKQHLALLAEYRSHLHFNRLKYMGHVDWELRASGVKFSGGTVRDLLTIQEAVEIAGLLRREEYIAAQVVKEESKPVTP